MFYLLLSITKSMRNQSEQPLSPIDNTREQIILLVEEYTQLCKRIQTNATR